MLKIFKMYFKENEQKWTDVIRKLKDTIDKLKADREFLLGKYFGMPENTESVLNNMDVTEANLMEHKILIQKLIGAVHAEEDRRTIVELEKKHFRDQVDQWIWQWDRIRPSRELRERIEQIDPNRIIDTHRTSDDFKTIKPNELALLVNAERFFMVMDHKTKWEIELSIIEERNKKLAYDNQELKYEMHELKEKLLSVEVIAKAKEHENSNLARLLKQMN